MVVFCQRDSKKQTYRKSPNAENMDRSGQPSDNDNRQGQTGKHGRLARHMGRQIQTDRQRQPDSPPPCLQVPLSPSLGSGRRLSAEAGNAQLQTPASSRSCPRPKYVGKLLCPSCSPLLTQICPLLSFLGRVKVRGRGQRPELRSHLPEEVDGQDNLQGCGPHQVEEGSQVHEALGIHRHEVDNFSHGGLPFG